MSTFRRFLLATLLCALLPTGCGSVTSKSPVIAVRHELLIAATNHERIFATAAAPVVGEILTTTNGTWTNNPTSFTYQWQHCNPTCTNISGATTNSYTIPSSDLGFTIDVIVTAHNAQGAASQTSAPTGTVASGGRVVPANPTGPPIPSGGWTVELADGFQACITFTSTNCSAGYPRTDGAWSPQTDGAANHNANEIDAFEPFALDVTTAGFVTTCTQTPNLGKNYTCGQILNNGGAGGTNSNAPISPAPFNWNPSSGTWAVQYQAQLPADQGNMDPGVWENGSGGTPEIDNAEYFGMHQQPTQTNTWCGMGWGFPAVPFGGSQSGTGDSQFWCSGTAPSFDPSTAFHTYTMYFSGGSYKGYTDGTQVTSGTYSVTSAPLKSLLGMSMRKDTATGVSYALPAGGVQLIIPYYAVYEATSANNAGTNGPIIEPGTSVG